jgi:hypothetical protein
MPVSFYALNALVLSYNVQLIYAQKQNTGELFFNNTT